MTRIASFGLLVVSLAAASAPAGAQTLAAGVSRATITFSPEEGEPDLPGRGRAGLIAGLGFEFLPSDRGFWQVEVLFHQKGARNLLRPDDAIRVAYLEIPWLLHMDMLQWSGDRAVFLTVGPVPAFALSASYEDDGAREDIVDDIARFDFGLAVGAGIESRRLRLQGRITWGQRRVFEDGDLAGKFKNRSAALMVSWNLR